MSAEQRCAYLTDAEFRAKYEPFLDAFEGWRARLNVALDLSHDGSMELAVSRAEATASVLASLRAGEMVAVPRKLLTEAHACMTTCGWQLAPAAEQGTDDDGVLALAVADIEAQFGELLAAAQPRRDEGNGDG